MGPSRGGHRDGSEPISDERLMEKYANGDPASFQILFDRYEARAHAYFQRRTGSVDRANDLFQELFLRVHRSRDRFDPKRSFAAWFFQIAHRLVLDDLRRVRRRRESPAHGRDECEWANRREEMEIDRIDAESLLAALTREERLVVMASQLEGVRYAELARQLDRSTAAVRQMASRAIRRLRGGAVGARGARAASA